MYACMYSTSHKKVKVPHRSSTEAVPNQYRINTERRANLDSHVYMYAVRCGARSAVRAVRDAGRALHARAI